MTPKKNPRRATIKGKTLQYSASIGEEYSRELRKMVRRMTEETKREVMALFRSDEAREYFATDANISIQFRELLGLLTVKFQTTFARYGEMLAERMVMRTNSHAKRSLESSFKSMSDQVTLKLSDMPEGMREILSASVSESVDLIKSIPSQYLDRVKGSVMRSITTKDGSIGRLTQDLQKYDGISLKRARNIALDQTRKTYQAVNTQRAKSAGVKKGIWVHTGGTKEPREKHKKYSGKEFDLSKGAPVGNNDEYVMPGEEPYCRCTWIPILDFGED